MSSWRRHIRHCSIEDNVETWGTRGRHMQYYIVFVLRALLSDAFYFDIIVYSKFINLCHFDIIPKVWFNFYKIEYDSITNISSISTMHL